MGAFVSGGTSGGDSNTHTSKCSFHVGDSVRRITAVVLVCSPSTVRTANGSGSARRSRFARPLAPNTCGKCQRERDMTCARLTGYPDRPLWVSEPERDSEYELGMVADLLTCLSSPLPPMSKASPVRSPRYSSMAVVTDSSWSHSTVTSIWTHNAQITISTRWERRVVQDLRMLTARQIHLQKTSGRTGSCIVSTAYSRIKYPTTPCLWCDAGDRPLV